MISKISNHNSAVSAAKAICIILMVIGHSGCPKEINEVLGLCRMPCFFFLSGYFFKEKYLNDMLSFIKRKVKGLWKPFVKWSLIFMILHNVFAKLHLYEDFYVFDDYKTKIFQIFTLTGSEQLLGGFWFLKELLYASIIAIFTVKLYFNFFKEKERFMRTNMGLFLSLLFVIFAYILSIIDFKIPTIGSRTMLATSFYFFGFYFSKTGVKNSLIRGFILSFILIIISFFFTGGISSVTDIEIFIYYIAGNIGAIAILDLSSGIKGKSLSVLDYIGGKTLYILTFHFISFKFVSLIKVILYDWPIEKLSSFPVIYEHNSYYWVLYSIIGVVMPLIIWNIVKIIENRIKKISL